MYSSSHCFIFGPQYTVKNLQFVLTVEPENEKVKQKLEWAQKQRQTNQPTVPSTIRDEFEINTFMRVDLPEVQVCNGLCPVLVHITIFCYLGSFQSYYIRS